MYIVVVFFALLCLLFFSLKIFDGKNFFIKEKNKAISEYNDVVWRVKEKSQRITEYIKKESVHLLTEDKQEIQTEFENLAAEITKIRTQLEELIKIRKRSVFIKKKEDLLDAIDRFYEKTGHLDRIYETVKCRHRDFRRQERCKEEEPHNSPVFPETFSYFAGCSTKKQLTKKYRELIKKHHPDNGGDPETFLAITKEYEIKKGIFL